MKAKRGWLQHISPEVESRIIAQLEESEAESDLVNEKVEEALNQPSTIGYRKKTDLSCETMPSVCSAPSASGYFKRSFTVTVAEFGRFENLTSDLSDSDSKVLKQIIASSFSSNDGWVPVPSKLIEKHARGFKREKLSQFVEMTSHSRFEHRCTDYRVFDWFISEVFRDFDIDSYWDQKKVNLISGRVARPEKSRVYNQISRNYEPRRIVDAIKVIEFYGCLFDKAAIERFLKETEGERNYVNNLWCYRAVLDQQPGQVDARLWHYKPAYHVANTGRIFHVRGGLQSCSRGMTAAAFSTVPAVRNYDIKSSHLSAAVIEFEIAGIDSAWLQSYLDRKNAKREFAEAVGISVDCWKRVLLAVLLGACLPKSTRNFAGRRNSVLDNLADEFDSDEEKMKSALIILRDVLGAVAEQISRWHNWLLSAHIEEIKKHTRQGEFITNAVGKVMWLGELAQEPTWKQKSRLVGFLLQGLECRLIYDLTALSEKYDYAPMMNAHDGLITVGAIPQVAVDEARRLSGFINAELEEKDFEPFRRADFFADKND